MLLWFTIFRKFNANERLDPYAYQDMMEEKKPQFAESILTRVDGGVHFLQSYDFIQSSSSFSSLSFRPRITLVIP